MDPLDVLEQDECSAVEAGVILDPGSGELCVGLRVDGRKVAIPWLDAASLAMEIGAYAGWVGRASGLSEATVGELLAQERVRVQAEAEQVLTLVSKVHGLD